MKKIILLLIVFTIHSHFTGFCEHPKSKSFSKTIINALNKYQYSSEIPHLFLTTEKINDLEKLFKKADPNVFASTLMMINIQLVESMRSAKKQWDNKIALHQSKEIKYKLTGYESLEVKDPSFGIIAKSGIYHMMRIEVFNKQNKISEKIKLTLIEFNNELYIAELDFVVINGLGFNNTKDLSRLFLESLNGYLSFDEASILFPSEQDLDTLAENLFSLEVYTADKSVADIKNELKERIYFLRANWSSIIQRLKAKNAEYKYKGFDQRLGTDNTLNYRNIGLFYQDKKTKEQSVIKFAALELNGKIRVVYLAWVFPEK